MKSQASFKFEGEHNTEGVLLCLRTYLPDVKHLIEKEGQFVFRIYVASSLSARETLEACKRINHSALYDSTRNITPNLAVYDNGGKTLDRYTIVDLDTKRGDKPGIVVYDAIGASETGAGFFLHIECSRGRHLGKKISFSQLPEELQAMVLSEYENND